MTRTEINPRRRHRSIIGLCLLVAVAAALLSVTACGRSNPTAHPAGESLDLLPSGSLSDWVSYADAVAVVTVKSERVLPVDNEVADRGEGLVGHVSTVSIDRVVWTRAGAPEPPTSIALASSPYVFNDGKVTDRTAGGVIDLEVGHQYLMPMLEFPEGWGYLTSATNLIISDGKIQTTDANKTQPFAADVTGLTPTEVGQVLESTKPDPVAAAHPELDAVKRFHVAQEAAREDEHPPGSD